jgi:hypothetical protein
VRVCVCGHRYGWYGSCCTPVVPKAGTPNVKPCPLESCKIMGAESGFVANGFQVSFFYLCVCVCGFVYVRQACKSYSFLSNS